MINTNSQHPVLNEADKTLLKALSRNAKSSIQELSELVHLSATPTTRRIKRLEELGVITGYHAHTSPARLGYTLSVFVAVSMDRHTAERFAEFEARIASFDEVVSCSVVTGRSEDYLLKVMVQDMRHYEEFLLHRLSKIDGVSQLHTSFELREVFTRSVV
ncbi:MAG: Lrp/AsnC family transcriptional regulator [Moraxella sp.]|nr:Lrp/AsnC family transcriptional regulator [Moraxella sp.]